jgi:two-component system sensor histidine kinase RegB
MTDDLAGRASAELPRPIAAFSPHLINFSWLVKLRWVAVTGQILTSLLAEWILQLQLPLGPMFTVIGTTWASNVFFSFWTRHGDTVGEWTVASVMILDVLLLTALLYLAGGPLNPFTSLYFVHVALGAMVLSAGWVWTLVLVSLACFGFLFVEPPVPTPASAQIAAVLRETTEGKWIAFGLAAAVTGYFVNGVRRALRALDAELASTRATQARSDKLASLATLSAGAAHELSTPLSTIAVAAKELERQIQRGARTETLVEDTQLIRQQVDRCRAILTQMAADAGHSLGELAQPMSALELVDQVVARLDTIGRSEARARIVRVTPADAATLMVRVPPNATAQALTGIVKNALDASPAEAAVELIIEPRETFVAIAVRDHGAGMPPDILARVGEPFFTTKEPGRGMGLGIFLARAVADRLGGALTLASTPGQGSTVTMTIPLEATPATSSPGFVERAVRTVARSRR